jgi:hypothetical protein
MPSWFYARGGQQQGPIEFDQLQALAAQHQLMPHDLVWTEGMADWQPASRVGGLVFTPPQVQPQSFQPQQQSLPRQPVQYLSQPQNYAVGGPASEQSTLAVTAFVLSVLGFFSCGTLGFGGLICGWAALNGMRRTGDFRRRGLALAAVWIGAIELFLMLIFLILFVIGIAVGPS